MKKISSFFIVFALMAVIALPVLAKASPAETLKEKREALRKELGLKNKELRNDSKVKARMGVLRGLAERALNLSQISKRIKTRMGKVKERGFDTARAEEVLAEADKSLESVNALIGEIKNDIEAKTSLKTIKEKTDAVKQGLKDANSLLGQANKELMKAVKSEVKVETEASDSNNSNN